MSAQTSIEATAEAEKKYFNDQVATHFAQQLGDGTSPLQRSGVPSIPYNPATGREYHGLNALNLMLQSKVDDRWLTWDEAKMAGLKIKKGEKATSVQYWPNKREGEEIRRAITAWVYNGEQLLGMPPMPHKPERADPLERVQEILKNSGATVVYDREQRGYYSSKNDKIHLPQPDKIGKEQFCEDALHQYFKSIGHPSRLDRTDTFAIPGRGKEAQEELISAIATMTMCADIGIPVQPARYTDLVETWQRSMTARPIDFARDMYQADKAVMATFQREQTRNRLPNTKENESWRAAPEEFPYGAVKTFLDRKEVLDALDKNPESLDRFERDGKEAFAIKESGRVLAKNELLPSNMSESQYELIVKARGFDRDGNSHDILFNYNISIDENGLQTKQGKFFTHYIRENAASMNLPRDWNGGLELQGLRQGDNGELVKSDTPELYGVMAKRENGDPELIASFDQKRDAIKYGFQMTRQYEYQGKQRGVDVDFDLLKNPDHGFPGPQKDHEAVEAEQSAPEAAKEKPLPEVEPTEQTRAECIVAMEAVGMLVTGKHPIFDGKGHRIDVEGDRQGQGTGWYIAHNDGRPAGTCVNNRSNVRADWSKSKGHRLTDSKKRELNNIAHAKKTIQQLETEAAKEQAVTKLHGMIEKTFVKPNEPTPYLAAKGLPLDPGIYQNKGATCIPIHDVKGTVHSMAYIQSNGTKRYAKDCDKEGHFYAYGGMEAVKNAKALIIGEGYSTVATVAIATNMPAVAVFDSGNLQPVAEMLHKYFPDKPIIIAADNDKNLELRDPPLKNAGLENATKAAEAVNGVVASPIWAKDTPVDKQHTDFDDLRRVNTREGSDGREGFAAVRSQLQPVIEHAIEQARENKAQNNEQEKTRGSRGRA